MRLTPLTILAFLLAIPSTKAAEPAAVAEQIDRAIDVRLKDAKLSPATLSGDAEFVRRVYLDITGRIPTAKQAAEFLADASADKRAKLIDQLLASPQYGEQFGRTWRDWIAPAELPSEGNGGNQPIKATQDLGKWLGERFNKGEGWDQIVRQLLTVEGNLKDQPQGIFYSLVGDDQGRPQPAGAARAISSLFLGQQIQCAECHNHPFTKLKQADFWGVAAFFKNVTWTFNGRYFDSIGEFTVASGDPKNPRKPVAINDKAPNGKITIPKESFKGVGTVHVAKFMDGKTVEPAEKQPLRPVLADWVTDRSNPYFAQAFVNRTWAYLFSRGLVTPVDDLRPDNPASHPEVMEVLAREFIESNYDVRHLVRCIVGTRAYQRSSKPVANEPKELVALFGRMPVRLMSADALYDSLKLAMSEPNLDLRNYDPKDAARFGESSPVGSAYDEFVKVFLTNEEDATDFTHGIPQFLTLINHPKLRTGGKAVDDLIKAKTEPAEAIEAMYLATLSRKPTAEEAGEALAFVSAAKDQRKAYGGVLWMLLNRSEFLLVR